jgi:uncharacterized protein YndB with AHSA1/START domain
MKGVLIVVATLVALVALLAVIGMLVPRDHVAGVTITVRQPPDSIWKVVRDLGGVPQWWSEMKKSERGPDGAGIERWQQEVGGFKMALLIETEEPPRRLVTRIDSPPDGPFGGTWTYDLTPVDSGTKFTVTERGWIGNPLFRFMSRFIFGYYGTQESYLRALGRRFGEEVAPARLPPE